MSSKKGILTIIILMAGLLYYTGCKTTLTPGASLNEITFSIFPHIITKNGEHYLQYQIKAPEGKLTLVRVLYSKISEGKAYYFFSTPISHPEKGAIVERPLKADGFTEFTKKNLVYWLNKDNSEVKLKITE